MSLKHALLIGAAIAAGWAIAQAPSGEPATSAAVVGKTGRVEGLVTVSTGTSVNSVTADSPILDGSSYVTGSTGTLELQFTDGCIVDMTPNQSVTVDSTQPCPERRNAIVALLPETTITAAALPALPAATPGTFSPALTGLGFVAAVALLDASLSTSPAATGGSNPGGGGGIPNPPPSGQ